jgi:EAL domain-containing protein (putative c-di-GMP-specific phosphodiesterase class I)
MTSNDLRIPLPPALDHVLRQATIVVVDDTPDNVSLLETLLRNAGVAHVHGFTDPRRALEACQQSSPDLVLVDLHMPHLDATELIGELNASLPEGVFLPSVVLTADMTTEARRRVLAAGAKDFISKPFDLTEVLLRVGNLLETAALYRRLQEHNIALRERVETHEAMERQAREADARRHARIDAVLAEGGPNMVFQPIVDVSDGTVAGAEALARFETEPRRPPNEWFDEAAAIGRAEELEVAAATAAIRRLDELPPGAFLSMNASPTVIRSGALTDLLASTAGERVVVEITEHEPVGDYVALREALDGLRNLGVRVAVDDTGTGYASLDHLLRLEADILKLDMNLTQGIDRDPVRRSLAAALLTFAAETGSGVIAEGVETAGELAELRDLGVGLVQGYHLGRPGPLPLPQRVEVAAAAG